MIKILFLGLILLCAGCNPPSRCFVVTDEYFWRLMSCQSENSRTANGQSKERDTAFEREFTRLAKDNRLSWQLKLVSLRERNFTALTEALTLHPKAVVLVSPLIVFEVEQIMQQFPDSAFIALDSAAAELMAPNLLTVTFDRRAVFREAGQKTALWLQNPASVEVLAALLQAATSSPHPTGSVQPVLPDVKPVKIGILSTYPVKQDRAEVESFKEGLAETVGAERILEKELPFHPANQPDLLPVFEEMYQAGVRIFLLKMYKYTEYCLEIVRSRGGLVIMEDGGRLQQTEPYILLSIEEDYLSSLQAAFADLVRGEQGIIFKNQRLPGQFSLRWHKAVTF